VVEPDGTLIDTFSEGSNLNGDGNDWREQTSGAKKKAPAAVEPSRQQVIRSTDGGASWSAPITVAAFTPSSPVDPLGHKRLRTADVVPSFAVDSRNGFLYATWQEAGITNSGSAVVLSSSTDGGLTWSTPIKVSKTPDSAPQGSGQAFTPMVDVSSTGAVAVTYYDFRNFSGGPGAATDYWAVTCKGGPACANDPAKWNEQHVGGSFDVTLAAVTGARGYFLGDYMGLSHDGPVFVSNFTMTHNLPNNQQDIYAAAIVP
jgi:hypothetical protein